MPARKPKRIFIVDGHPDARRDRLVHRLVEAYARGAAAAGHETHIARVADLDFPLLRKPDDFMRGAVVPAVIKRQQELITWADHLVVAFPLWLGSMPALLKAYFEQTWRPGFAYRYARSGLPKPLLEGRSARVIVAMGGPAMYYRLVYRAHSLKSLERNILAFAGFGPIRDSVIGQVDEMTPQQWEAWANELAALGRGAR